MDIVADNGREIRARVLALSMPKVLLILSGKRKCGKDFLEQLVLERYREQLMPFRISAPIKGEFALRYGLDLSELLSDSPYKEIYRKKMVTWSNFVRDQDASYFLRMAIEQAAEEAGPRPFWLLNDARRPNDLEYFKDAKEIDMSRTKVITLRVHSNEEVRTARGWTFTAEIDDQVTECGLDGHVDWHYLIENNGTREELLEKLAPVFAEIDRHLL